MHIVVVVVIHMDLELRVAYVARSLGGLNASDDLVDFNIFYIFSFSPPLIPIATIYIYTYI